MFVRRALIPLALALFAARCADGPHPTAVQEPLAPAPHFLRWAGGSQPQFTTIGAVSDGSGDGLVLALAPPSGGLSLDRYTAAFWAVRGAERSVQINYVSSLGDTSWQFLRLTTVDPTYVPGLGDLAPGDSVLITVTVDPYNIKVSLEPTGLLFGDPAQLQISYSGAGGDLNGDGVVDDTDAYIESQLLGMWYREGGDTAWTRISATPLPAQQAFTTELPHFSEYSVSW